MARIAAVVYGYLCYLIFLLTFLYAVGFVGNFVVPKSIDSGNPIGWLPALIINAILLGIFAVQHSVMARQGFKRWWSRFVSQPVERSTYVLLSSAALIVLYVFWQPMPALVWSVENELVAALLWILFAFGWFMVLIGTMLFDHFELFGLRQVHAYYSGTQSPASQFKTPFLYRWVRHPMMLGFLLAFWATPAMSVGHLLFAVATTAYILLAVLALEERDLVAAFGDEYRDYQRRVPGFLPIPKRANASKDRIKPA